MVEKTSGSGMDGRQDPVNGKVRAAADRTISEPGNTPAISPPAQRQVNIITPARHAGKTHYPMGRR